MHHTRLAQSWLAFPCSPLHARVLAVGTRTCRWRADDSNMRAHWHWLTQRCRSSGTGRQAGRQAYRRTRAQHAHQRSVFAGKPRPTDRRPPPPRMQSSSRLAPPEPVHAGLRRRHRQLLVLRPRPTYAARCLSRPWPHAANKYCTAHCRPYIHTHTRLTRLPNTTTHSGRAGHRRHSAASRAGGWAGAGAAVVRSPAGAHLHEAADREGDGRERAQDGDHRLDLSGSGPGKGVRRAGPRGEGGGKRVGGCKGGAKGRGAVCGAGWVGAREPA